MSVMFQLDDTLKRGVHLSATCAAGRPRLIAGRGPEAFSYGTERCRPMPRPSARLHPESTRPARRSVQDGPGGAGCASGVPGRVPQLPRFPPGAFFLLSQPQDGGTGRCGFGWAALRRPIAALPRSGHAAQPRGALLTASLAATTDHQPPNRCCTHLVKRLRIEASRSIRSRAWS